MHFPLAKYNLIEANSIWDEASEIIQYNTPFLKNSYAEIANNLQPKSNFHHYRKMLEKHFNLQNETKIKLLFQYDNKLFLSYAFSSALNTEYLRTALIKSKNILDKFFLRCKDYKLEKHPIHRDIHIYYLRDFNKNSEPNEELTISEEIQKIHETLGFNYSAYDKLAILLKLIQNIIKENEEFSYLNESFKEIGRQLRLQDAEIKFSDIEIDEKGLIKLSLYNLEIPMQALHKAVYILFLDHSEGIELKDLDNYKETLLLYYTKLSPRKTKLKKSIDELLNPENNNLYECLSRIKEAFLKVMDDKIAKFYYIKGARGEKKYVKALKRSIKVKNHFHKKQ